MNKTTTLIKNRYTLAEEYVGIEDTFVPARGVTIIYPVENGYQKVKLGDGVTTLADLPWCGTPGVGGDVELIKVVDSLPETGEENKIYLVPISGFPTAEPGVYEHGSNFTKLVYSLNEPIDVDGYTYYYYSEEYLEAEFILGGDVILPYNGVESIALSYCGDIVIPASVTSLELSCFSNSSSSATILGDATECKLTTIYSKATTPPSWTGNGTPYLTKIVVPKGCAEAYKSANVWKNFADIIVETAEGSEQNLFDEWIWINKGTEDAPEYAWEWITTKQVEVDLSAYATKDYADTKKLQVVTTYASNWIGNIADYNANVPGITSLTNGATFIMIPHKTSTSSTPSLNVNNLGVKYIYRCASNSISSAYSGPSTSWLQAGNPVTVTYSNGYWKVKELTKPAASDLTGTVSVYNGGTGATTLAANAVITGNGTGTVKTVSTANGALYATAAGGAAQFGTLPIAQGGTGATTAAAAVSELKSALVDLLYPVGSIYMSANSASPSTLFGGEWEAWGQGRVPVGMGSNGTDNYSTVESEGGAASVSIALTENNMPSHNHVFTPSGSVSSTFTGTYKNTENAAPSHSHTITKDGSHSHTATVYYRPPSGAGSYTAHAGSRDNSSSSSATSWVSISSNGEHSHGGSTQAAAPSHAHGYTPAGTVTSTFTGTTAGSSSAGSGAAFSVNTMQPYITCYMWKRTA
jgi:hypothetical protein